MSEQQNTFLASNLKHLRERNNLSVGELAIKLRVKKETYYAWESGRNIPDVFTLNTIAELYHITITQLCLLNVNTICIITSASEIMP